MNATTGRILVGLFILWICALRAEVGLLWLQQYLEKRLKKPPHGPVKRYALRARTILEVEDLNR